LATIEIGEQIAAPDRLGGSGLACKAKVYCLRFGKPETI
jgi:hypothetical protein